MQSINIKNLTYKFATLKSDELDVAKEIYSEYPDFHEKQSDEVLQSVKEGAMLKWQELNPAKSYSAKDWTPVKDGTKGAILATAEWAMSVSTQKTNSMKKDEPGQHAILRSVQIPCGAYISATKVALVAKVREHHNVVTGIKKERAPTAWFTDHLKTTFVALKTRCKTAKGRGDDGADSDKLDKAIAAFNAVWLK